MREPRPFHIVKGPGLPGPGGRLRRPAPLPLAGAAPPRRSDLEPPTREDLPFVGRRLSLFFLCFLTVLLTFLARTYQLTVLEGPTYRDLSENNFLLENPVVAPRGRILARHGEPLAVNQTFFKIEMSPFHLTRDEVTSALGRLSELMNDPLIAKKVDQVMKKRPRWKTVDLATNLDLGKVLPVVEQGFDLPGVLVTQDYRRFYPQGELTGLITGHVGAIALNQIETMTSNGYISTEKIGRMGSELAFEDELHGEVGSEMITRDAQGRIRARYSERPARPGHSVTLTIDLGMQSLAQQLLQGWKGCIIAMDPRDGAILSMVSNPGFDPAIPSATGTSEHPLTSFNKASNGVFAPGSTFKIVTASGGLLSGFSPHEITDCDGYYEIPGVKQKFPCDLRSGHGGQDLSAALQHSCNIYFYKWAQKMGGPMLISTARKFGFGMPTGFDLASADGAGFVANPEVDPIYVGSVLHMGIGQGQLLTVTPLQLARAYAALANGGTLYAPHVFMEERQLDGELVNTSRKQAVGKLPIDEDERKTIMQGLWRVVNETGGTGARYGIKPEWHVVGKTGTAQTGRGKPNAWFVCASPAENPEILFLVLVEDAGHGGEMAAPVARQLLAYYYHQPEPQIVPPSAVPKETSTD